MTPEGFERTTLARHRVTRQEVMAIDHDVLADLLEKLTALVPRIAIVQLSDCIGEPWSAYDRVFPGDGQLPIIPVMDALLAAGYTGMFDVQVWSPALWSSNYQHILRQCRDRFENLCSLSASA